MEDEYFYAPFTPDKVNDITKLISAIHGSAAMEVDIRKKYSEFKPGFSPIGFIAYSKFNKEPVAYYGIFPVQVVLNNKVIFAAQSGDTMTHPHHRGKGLFIRLAKMTYEKAKYLEISFVFGFPNDNSYPGFSRKLNWVFTGKMRKYRIWIITLPLSVIAFRARLFMPMYRMFVHFILKLFSTERNSFQNSSISGNSGGILRDALYMKYKTFGNNYVIKFKEGRVWMEPSRTMITGDIEFNGQTSSRKILNKLKILSFLLGIPRIDFEVSPGSSWDNLLSRYYRDIDSYPIGFLVLNGNFDFSQIHFNHADYDFF